MKKRRMGMGSLNDEQEGNMRVAERGKVAACNVARSWTSCAARQGSAR